MLSKAAGDCSHKGQLCMVVACSRLSCRSARTGRSYSECVSGTDRVLIGVAMRSLELRVMRLVAVLSRVNRWTS